MLKKFQIHSLYIYLLLLVSTISYIYACSGGGEDAQVILDGNSAPVAVAGLDQTMKVGNTATLDGSGSSDVDGDALTFKWTLTPPPGSAAVLSDPSAVKPTFYIDVPGTYTVQLIVNDGKANSASDTVRIGTVNSAPVAHAGTPQTALVGQTVILDGSGSIDVDGDSLTFSWALTTVPAGSVAALSDPAAVTPAFDVDLPGTYVAQLIVHDGTVNSAADTVSIGTTASAPVADAGPDQTALIGDTVTLDGSGSSDADGDSLTFSWALTTVPAGSGAALSDPAAVTPAFDVDLPGTYVAQLIVHDGTVNSAADTVSIGTINSAPVADAGPGQTALVGDTVTLDGSGSSDADGDSLTFSWALTTVPAGSGAALSDPATVTPAFDVDLPGTYVAQLIVHDGTVNSAADTVSIGTINSAPVADAGPDQTALVGDTVVLDGSGSSDADGDALTFSWALTSVPAGSGAVLSDPVLVNPTFGVDLKGTYVAQLVVNDGTVNSAADTVSIATINIAPVADAGPDQTALVGDTVTLDGSGSSDADGDSLTFSWALTTVPAGSGAALSDPAAVTPTFDVDLPGTYVAQLIVHDGTVNSAADTVSIGTINSAPVADAGPDQTALVGDTVTLDGSGSSDADGDALTFSWALTSVPTGSGAALFDPALVNPTFGVDLPGTYVAQLIVNDGAVNSAADTVSISTVNSAPVADAGPDQAALVGDTVMLDGSGSIDADGDSLTFSWTLAAVPTGSGVAMSDPSAVTPALEIDLPGTYVAQLIVNDGTINSAADTVTIAASAVNGVPVADAGVDQEVVAGLTVTLDGGGSTDPDGDPLTYSWELQDKPSGSLVLFTSTEVNPAFIPDVDGSYMISLVVNDGAVDSAADTVVVTATAAAGGLKYDADCASCHAAGSYDATTSSGASDLYNKGNLVITDISSYSNKKSNVDDLTDQEILDLRAFLDHPSIAP